MSQKQSTTTGKASTPKPPETYVLWNPRRGEIFVLGDGEVWEHDSLGMARLQQWHLAKVSGTWEIKTVTANGELKDIE